MASELFARSSCRIFERQKQHSLAETSAPWTNPCRPTTSHISLRHTARNLHAGRLAASSAMQEDSENGVPMGFAAYDLEERLQQDQAESLEEYAELKDLLLKRTQRAGAFLAGYLFLTVSGPAALSTLVGTAGSYAYLRWLIHDMDGLSEDMVVPFRDARAQPGGPVQTAALGFAAYRQALRPRLLVAVVLAAAVAAFNTVSETPLGRVEQACLLAGFLSYKAALLLNVWDSLRPRVDPEVIRRPRRPELAVLPPVEELAKPGNTSNEK
ncbi:hypothetical protein WJX75_009264 [Coccomyxa subellipsoidea]|uniref:Uncharacterized protein n=1 Tax=Coccomyxa subellipsoidea TaxID=248742 RepID=A0ABR2YWW3_9CHLO